MKHFTLLLILTLTSLTVLAQDHTAEIDKLFSDWESIEGPGATVAVMKDGEILFSKGYGAANIEYGIPNTPSTIFHVASVSKQFTVYAVMLLVQDGKLSWDDDIRKHIPEVPDFGHKITLRHLAVHTSGMRDQWNLLAAAGWRMDDVITNEQVLRLLSRQEELNFEPGEEFVYCNSGFTLLAEVVARTSGKTFDEFTQERMFGPLGMENTLFYEDHQRIVKNRAYSYQGNEGDYDKDVLSYAVAGATSLFTTAEDLCTWAHHMNNPTPETESIITEMNTLATLNNGNTFGGAMGQFVNEYKGVQQIQHGGADAGYRTYLGRFPDQDLSVAVLSNYANFNPGRLALEVVSLYLESNDDPEDEQQASAGFIERDFVEMSRNELEKFTGSFWYEEGSYSRRLYINDSGQLMYNRGGSNENELKPIDDNTLQMQGIEADLLVTFEEIDGQRAMIVTIDEDERYVSIEYEPTEYNEDLLNQYTGQFYSTELDTDYRLSIMEGDLVASHLRTGDVTLTGSKGERFSGNRWYMGSVEFQRDDAGKVTGFLMSSGRVRNLRFVKVED